MWGVSHVEVDGTDRPERAQDPVSLELVVKAEKAVAALFGVNDLTHPFMNTLSRYCVERKTRALQESLGGEVDLDWEAGDGE
jgi:hypothetical protein